MKKEHRHKGYWWLPDNPENKIAGILTFKPSKAITLELIGGFDVNEEYFICILENGKKITPIIYGEDEDSKSITLFNCTLFGKLNLSCSFPVMNYNATYCIVGMHLISENDKIFNRVDIGLPLLTMWMNRYPVHQSILIKNDKITRDFDFSYRMENNIKIFTLNKNLSLSFYHNAIPSEIYKDEITIKQKYLASIESKICQSFLYFLEEIWRLKSFLSMATLTENDFDYLALYSPDYYQELGGDKKVFHQIEIYFKQISIEQDFLIKSSTNFLFTYSEMEKEFQNIIKKWFSFNRSIMPILNHLIHSLDFKKVFSSVDFLIVIYALEGYQRRFIEKNKSSNSTLESRLKNLRNKFSKDVKNVRDIDLSSAVNSRNYYSHFYPEKEKSNVVSGEKLYDLTKRLRNLLICCFLHELGLSNKKISEIIDKRNN